MNLFALATKLEKYLREKNVAFTDDGYPIFTEDMMLQEMPKYIYPITHMSCAKDPSNTLLVSFTNDKNIYRRLFNLEKDIAKYQKFMGVAGFDLSPCIEWDVSQQKFNILLNMLATAYLAVNGIKIVPNFRIGTLETIDVLRCYPQNSWFVVGALGCAKGNLYINKQYLRIKLIITNPDKLIYYGKLKCDYIEILDEFGIDYAIFDDYQSISRKK